MNVGRAVVKLGEALEKSSPENELTKQGVNQLEISKELLGNEIII